MDIAGFAQFDGDGHAGVGHLEGLEHLLANPGPTALGRLFLGSHEIGQLHPGEGELVAPVGPPVADHGGQLQAVGLSPTGIGFALIPDGAPNGIGTKRGDHAVVEIAGPMRCQTRIRRRTRPARCRLALGLGACGGVFPAGQGLFVLLFGLFRIIRSKSLLPAFQQRLEFFLGLLGLHTGPGFHRRAAPGRIDQPHGNTQLAVQLAAEEERSGRKAAHRLGSAHLPLAFAVVLWCFGRTAGNGHMANLRQIGGGLLLFEIAATAHGHGHVRLSRGQPHLAHQDVLQFDRILALYLEHVRPAGGKRL